MFSRPKILFLVSLLFVALLNPKFNPYLLFKFLIFYHSSIYIYIYIYIYIVRGKILEWEKIGEFGELWSLRQYFTRQ